MKTRQFYQLKNYILEENTTQRIEYIIGEYMPHSIFIFNVLDYPFYFKYLIEVCKI